MNKISLVLAGVALSTSVAAAQVTVISTEQFDYVPPALLQNASGGTGWANAWDIPGGLGNEVVIFDPTVNPQMSCRDNVGNYAGQAVEYVAAARRVDQSGHSSVVEAGMIGADGATIWISFRTVMYQQFGTSGPCGAVQLFSTSSPGNEQLLLGSPWGLTAWNWGWDDEGGVGLPPEIDPMTDAAVCAKLVFRIDHMPGDERVRMWVDPAADFPITETPNLDGVIGDLRWDEIRINSGGSGTHFFWDDLVIARGEPTTNVGTLYCTPAVVNSSGQPASIGGAGTTSVANNDLTLIVDDLPQNSFGFFLTSRAQGLVVGAGGSQGNLCLGGAVGRYVGPGQIMNSGGAGTFDLLIDLASTPTPIGLVQVLPGETWNFQCWFRDAVGGMATSNFTDGLEIAFQ